MSGRDLLSVEEASALFGVHRTTLFRWIKERRLSVEEAKLGDRRTYLARTAVEKLLGPAASNVGRCLELVYRQFTATGEWPRSADIQREIDREAQRSPQESFDFLAAIETLPHELGWRVRDLQGQAQLTLQGIARCENSAEDVNAFLALVRTCFDQYIGADPAVELRVTGAQLATGLGFNGLMIRKLHKLLQIEAVFWTSLSGGLDGSMEVDLNPERIRHFREIQTLDDYLAAKQKALQPVRGPMWSAALQPDLSLEPVQTLHPVIADAVQGLLESNEPTAAVMAAATALERLMARRIDGDRDKLFGHRLVTAYFEKVQRTASPNPRRVEALRSIVLGTLGAFRNPAAHGQEFMDAHAREIVTLFSLLAREVEVLPMPVIEVHPYVRFDEATPESRQAFAAAGQRLGALASESVQKVPTDWYCEVHLNVLDRSDVGLTHGDGIEPMPICPMEGCPGRGWSQVHPLTTIPSVVVGGGGQRPVRAGTRIHGPRP